MAEPAAARLGNCDAVCEAAFANGSCLCRHGRTLSSSLGEAFLRHVARASSQYDDMCRTMAAEILHLRNRLETFEETERGAVANANRAWEAVRVARTQPQCWDDCHVFVVTPEDGAPACSDF